MAPALHVVTELVREARERILTIVAELVGVEVRGLTRAGHPDPNEAGLIVGEHHSIRLTGSLGLSLSAAGAAAYPVAVDGERPIEAGAPRQPLPETGAAGKSLLAAVPGDAHSAATKHALYRRRRNGPPAMADWRLVARLWRMRP